MYEKIYMSSYILDAVSIRHELSGMEWAWSLTETVVNMYFKLWLECRFRGVTIWLSDQFVTPMYRLIFEQYRICMLWEVTKALLGTAYWYASPSKMFIWVFNVEKPPLVLPNFSLDVLHMQEVVYHISIGLIARLQRKKKAPWPTLSLQIGLYEIKSIKKFHVEEKKNEEVPVRPLKLQPVWPTLHCGKSLLENSIQLDPWGMSVSL